MPKDIVAVSPLPGHRLHLRFEDGAEGTVALADLVAFTGIFAPLADPEVFAGVRLNAELGTIEWPNGADLDPDVLYAIVTGTPLPTVGGAMRSLCGARSVGNYDQSKLEEAEYRG